MNTGTRQRLAEVVAVALATTHNWASHRRLPRAVYVPANLAVAAAMAGLARWGGATWTEIGLAPHALPSGLRSGLAAGAAVAGTVALAAAVPGGRGLFHDERARSCDRRGALYELGLRIPVGTALAEEVAFRGALLALSARRRGWHRAALWTSALFGLWHVLPAMDHGPLYGDEDSPVDVISHPSVWVSVVGTAAAGAGLARLRHTSGSVVAPAVAHATANIAAFALARRDVSRRGAPVGGGDGSRSSRAG